MNLYEIELAISKLFNSRVNMVVPNISWGLNLHECDILILTKSGYLTEVEIKTSRADLLVDKKKKHGHNSNKIKRLFFAVPIDMQEFALLNIPERAGLIVVIKDEYDIKAKIVKKPIINKLANIINNNDIIHLGHLASMRIWSLKSVIINQERDIEYLRKEIKSGGSKFNPKETRTSLF